jgi:hypothetical protein
VHDDARTEPSLPTPCLRRYQPPALSVPKPPSSKTQQQTHWAANQQRPLAATGQSRAPADGITALAVNVPERKSSLATSRDGIGRALVPH